LSTTLSASTIEAVCTDLLEQTPWDSLFRRHSSAPVRELLRLTSLLDYALGSAEGRSRSHLVTFECLAGPGTSGSVTHTVAINFPARTRPSGGAAQQTRAGIQPYIPARRQVVLPQSQAPNPMLDEALSLLGMPHAVLPTATAAVDEGAASPTKQSSRASRHSLASPDLQQFPAKAAPNDGRSVPSSPVPPYKSPLTGRNQRRVRISRSPIAPPTPSLLPSTSRKRTLEDP